MRLTGGAGRAPHFRLTRKTAGIPRHASPVCRAHQPWMLRRLPTTADKLAGAICIVGVAFQKLEEITERHRAAAVRPQHRRRCPAPAQCGLADRSRLVQRQVGHAPLPANRALRGEPTGKGRSPVSNPMETTETTRRVSRRPPWRWPAPSCRVSPDSSSRSRRMPTCSASASRSLSDRCWWCQAG
jgi:hypothetical protein